MTFCGHKESLYFVTPQSKITPFQLKKKLKYYLNFWFVCFSYSYGFLSFSYPNIYIFKFKSHVGLWVIKKMIAVNKKFKDDKIEDDGSRIKKNSHYKISNNIFEFSKKITSYILNVICF